jgi:hypothetical protein
MTLDASHNTRGKDLDLNAVLASLDRSVVESLWQLQLTLKGRNSVWKTDVDSYCPNVLKAKYCCSMTVSINSIRSLNSL